MAIIMRRCRMATYSAAYIRRGFGNGAAWVEDGVGEYLADFDPEANEGRGKLILTPDPVKAKRFSAANETILFMQQIPPGQRWRDDGRPNRPLTDFGWELEVRPDASFTVAACPARGPSVRPPLAKPRVARRRRRARSPDQLPSGPQAKPETMLTDGLR